MPIYLIYGEEDYLQEQIVKAMKESLLTPGFEAFNLDEIDSEKKDMGVIVERAISLPVFAEKRLVIVRNCPVYQKMKKDAVEEADRNVEPLLAYLEDPLLSTCLIFLVNGSIDKRKKTVKAIEKRGQVLETAALKGKELEDWIKEETHALGKKIEPKTIDYIIFNSHHSLRALKSELEKMALYTNGNIITMDTAEKLLTKTAEADVFALVDSIGQKKGESAILELRKLLETGEPAVRVLFMIARQFRLLLSVKDLRQKGYAEKQITSELSLHPYVTGKIYRQSGNFSFRELEDSMQFILDTDISIKTGAAPKTALENLILKLVK